MELLLGMILIIGGVAYSIYMYRKRVGQTADMRETSTSSVYDAVTMLKKAQKKKENSRCYVELKGQAKGDTLMKAPFSGREAVYYLNICRCVTEKTQNGKDKEGNTRAYTAQKEHEIFSEHSSQCIYIQDAKTGNKIYVDVDRFGENAQLLKVWDRLESEVPSWLSNRPEWLAFQEAMDHNPDVRFLGCHLIEWIVSKDQDLYLLGELYRQEDQYYIGGTEESKKRSCLSYKTEAQLVHEFSGKKWLSLGIGGLAAAAGAFLVIVSLL
ncbi:MAG: GIDE domain-containing protein [Massiliimalia sp.]|jgi:hypothetical protein